MYRYLFGPVPSRRLGMSLGVDLVPRKTCSLDCVYCEVGKTTLLTGRRDAYVPVDLVIGELEDFFSRSPDPEYITFSGSGEPTLNSGIGEILQYIRKKKPGIPTALLTNGTLLTDPALRREVITVDGILPSLDAATETDFRAINRPATGLDISSCIEGLVEFKKAYTGTMQLEVFMLPGYNMEPDQLDALEQALLRIGPDAVQLNTLDRPGTETGLHAASPDQLKAVRQRWNSLPVEIIASAAVRRTGGGYRGDRESAILETISRRPCTEEDLIQILGLHHQEIQKYLGVLHEENRIESVRQNRGTFYRLTGTVREEDQS